MDRVDGVYIATPHSHHDGFIDACLRAGKPVLCEKPLVVNRPTAERLVALARSRKVFLMEALWTRFLPIYEVVGTWLDEGAIGRPRHIQSSFCFPAAFDPGSRLFAPDLPAGLPRPLVDRRESAARPERSGYARDGDAVLERPGKEPEIRTLPFRVNGFEYQLEEAMACVRRGDLQSERIRHEDSCAVIGWMDEIRRRIGVAYPFE